MASLTGGQLNYLNGKYGISAPDKSVPVMKLIRTHSPNSREELLNLIKSHSETTCKCGIKSQGSVEDFGQNLYEAQLKEWGEYKFSLQECINWEYNLFVIQSLKGNLIENKAKEQIQQKLTDCSVADANNYYDEELRIDLEIKKSNKTIAGIQVKPSSYEFVRQNVKYMNIHRNKMVDFEVLYLYYDYDTEEFINIKEVVESIIKISSRV